MPSMLRLALLLGLLAAATVCSPASARADDAPKAKAAEQLPAKPADEGADADEPDVSITHGAVTIDGVEVPYTATAGKFVQRDEAGKPKAEVFFVYYARRDPAKTPAPEVDVVTAIVRAVQGEDDKETTPGVPAGVDTKRPITFCFNGGPGASSVWLHLGMLGPRRVKLPAEAVTPRPPYEVVDNPFSLLDVTDLVFVDPVGTGFSRPAEGEKNGQFTGYKKDLSSIGKFVHDFVTKHDRWESPKFLLGESYGGLRVAGLSGELQQRYGMYLNGVVMVSAVVDFTTLDFASNNDLPYVLFLPGYAATAWKHKALAQDLLAKPLEAVVAEATEFAYGPYADALLRGASLPADHRKQVAERYARLTGLPLDYAEGANLRVSQSRFAKQLLRERDQVVGRFDGRYVGLARDPIAEKQEYDPSFTAVLGAFTGAMNGYLADELDYRDELVYEVLTGAVHPWSYEPFVNRYVTAGDTLRQAMLDNPHLHTLAACGYYDLATPATAMEHTRDHTMLEPALRERFTTTYYEAGHMMYLHEPSLVKLRKDLLEFYRRATP
ncbi:MAG: S10 family peptidase [Lacipirellulaceae bacterium]